MARIRALAKGEISYKAMALQWPEFMGFVISQITDLRGTLIRDESKFARLVAHTDEIVRAMEGVAQLSERLYLLNNKMDAVIEMVASRRDEESELTALEHFGLADMDIDGEDFRAEFTKLFKLTNHPAADEPVLTESDLLDNEDD